MTKEERKEAISRILHQLEYGYVDISDDYDTNEVAIIKEAIDNLQVVDKWNEMEDMLKNYG
jgi:hypothetical protein